MCAYFQSGSQSDEYGYCFFKSGICNLGPAKQNHVTGEKL